MISIYSLNDATSYLEAHSDAHITFSSPTYGLRTHGVGYFAALVRNLTKQFPTHTIDFVVDAGEDVGLAIAALEAGFKRIVISRANLKLEALAAAYDAKVFDKTNSII